MEKYRVRLCYTAEVEAEDEGSAETEAFHTLERELDEPGLGLVERFHLPYNGWPSLTCHNMLYPEFHAVPGEPAKGLAHCLLSVE